MSDSTPPHEITRNDYYDDVTSTAATIKAEHGTDATRSEIETAVRNSQFVLYTGYHAVTVAVSDVDPDDPRFTERFTVGDCVESAREILEHLAYLCYFNDVCSWLETH